jgi:hypothetical protein
MSVRERVAEFDALTRAHPDERYICLSVAADRHDLLVAGDALASMVQAQHPVTPMPALFGESALVWCDGCDAPEADCWAVPALAAWEAVTG